MIVLVDDTLTKGNTIAAADSALGRPSNIFALTVAQTDSIQVSDCYDLRKFAVEYDHAAKYTYPTVTAR